MVILTKLFELIELLVAPVDENAHFPRFETAPTNKSSSSDTVEPQEPVLTLDDNEPAPSIEEEYYDAVELASRLPKNTRFEGFNCFHQKSAANLINVFYKLPRKKLIDAFKYAQKHVSVSLLNYALAVALIHREDVIQAYLQLPSHVFTDPGMYFDMSHVTAFLDNEEVTETKFNENGITKRFVNIERNFTASDHDPEHKVAYFREDLGLNLHHRHWHEVYPFEADEFIVNKDRRGELFYYMHQQIMARYNFERLCNGLTRAKPYADFAQPIEEAYFPKLNSLTKSSQFCSRPANTVLKDLNREYFYVKLSNMELWRNRLFDAIDRGYAYAIDKETGKEVIKEIDQETGINELGNSIEAVEKLSWNYQYYGDLHNKGHLFFSYVHDPDHRFREGGSVMSHTETALRDPIFYRWHAFMDDIFQHYKRTLPPYTLEQRQFKGINIKSVQIHPEDHPDHHQSHLAKNHENILKTFYEKDAIDVTRGILNQDPNKTKEEVYAIFNHLQHEDFKYVIEVFNDLPKTVIGTVRIFLAPHAAESGLEMPFNQQRRLFIEMDKFTHQIPPGNTTITRKSTQSAVTIPFEKTFLTISDVKKLASDLKLNEDLNNAINGYCGCGWPHHLLVGRGITGQGYLCDLFVMITDYETDKVEDSPLTGKYCEKSSISYCGVRNKKYPDRKPMGFPFDREISDLNATIHDFMTEKQQSSNGKKIRGYKKIEPSRLSNMIVVPLRVRHEQGPTRCASGTR